MHSSSASSMSCAATNTAVPASTDTALQAVYLPGTTCVSCCYSISTKCNDSPCIIYGNWHLYTNSSTHYKHVIKQTAMQGIHNALYRLQHEAPFALGAPLAAQRFDVDFRAVNKTPCFEKWSMHSLLLLNGNVTSTFGVQEWLKREASR